MMVSYFHLAVFKTSPMCLQHIIECGMLAFHVKQETKIRDRPRRSNAGMTLTLLTRTEAKDAKSY